MVGFRQLAEERTAFVVKLHLYDVAAKLGRADGGAGDVTAVDFGRFFLDVDGVDNDFFVVPDILPQPDGALVVGFTLGLPLGGRPVGGASFRGDERRGVRVLSRRATGEAQG